MSFLNPCLYSLCQLNENRGDPQKPNSKFITFLRPKFKEAKQMRYLLTKAMPKSVVQLT